MSSSSAIHTGYRNKARQWEHHLLPCTPPFSLLFLKWDSFISSKRFWRFTVISLTMVLVFGHHILTHPPLPPTGRTSRQVLTNSHVLSGILLLSRLALIFLDLHIEIVNGKIITKLFEKALNLYLYLPSHSSHPPGMVHGLIHSMVLRIFRLSSDPSDALHNCKRFGQHLVARGYSPSFVFELINQSIHSTRSQHHSTVSTTATKAPSTFLHIPYHPMNPASKKIQALFRQDFFPRDGTALPDHCNPPNRAHLGIKRLIVAYSQPRNLGNYFSPRKLSGPSVAASAVLLDMRRSIGASNPDPSLP
jgi:hypothetical protein